MTEESISDRLKRLPSEVRMIVEKRIELVMLDVGEKLSATSGKAVTSLLLLLVVGFAFLFLFIALAIFLGDVLRNPAGGFMLVAVFLFIAAFFAWRLLPNLIERKVKNSMLDTILKKTPEPNE
jgi:uncharacterized membrane protein YqjE